MIETIFHIVVNVLLVLWLVPAVAFFGYNWVHMIVEAHGTDVQRENAKSRVSILLKTPVWPVLFLG
jgi:hypothetical protein